MTDHEVRVWDPLVRVFHWSLVAAFAIAWLSGDEESLLHIYSGYFIIGLVAFRVLWGFMGSRHARFGDFLYSPRRTLQYLKSLRSGTPEVFLGHNPAGGWMIVLLLVSLALTSYTGLKVYGVEGHGPLAATAGVALVTTAQADEEEHEGRNGAGREGEDFWEEIHEFFANLTVFLVVIHVAGVVVASRLHGENLVRAMITGNKRTH
jgi:cytochrome b